MNTWAGRFDMSKICTTPGSGGPFAPPQEWDGDADEYIAWLRKQYRQQHIKQQMYVAARWGGRPNGRYADAAASVIHALYPDAHRRG